MRQLNIPYLYALNPNPNSIQYAALLHTFQPFNEQIPIIPIVSHYKGLK